MSKHDEMSNNQIMTEIKSLQAEHEAIKMKMLKDYDLLEQVEKNFKKAEKVLAGRIKGQRNE